MLKALIKLLTQSRMRSYRSCARKESYQYVHGWRPIEESEALFFGTLWHKGMEVWWACLGDDNRHPLESALAEVEGKAQNPFQQVIVEELLRGYNYHWLLESQRDYEVLGVEESFTAPLVNPETMGVSKTWVLAGKLDGRVKVTKLGDLMDGKHLIVEHKTTSEDISPESSYWPKLSMDHQLSIYTIGAETLGETPEGALYDVVKKPMIRPKKATPEESRKYKKDGSLYANQRDVDETVEEFRERLRESISEDPDKYFQRRSVSRNEDQIKDFLFDAWAQAKTMHEGHKLERAPRNPESCNQYGQCPFWQVCSTGSDPSDYPYDFKQIDDVNPELAEEEAPNEDIVI